MVALIRGYNLIAINYGNPLSQFWRLKPSRKF